VKVAFVGQTARDADNPTGNPCRLINAYREPMVPGGRAGAVLRSVPGMADFVTIDGVFMRALTLWNNLILTVVGMNLYSVSSGGVATLLGDVQAADNLVGLDQSTGVAVVVSNRKYWTWNGTTLANVATGSVTEPASVAYLGGYVIVSQYNGRVFQWSGLAAPSAWNGLDFASAEITAEPIIRLIAFKDALYIFKRGGYERWAVFGGAGPDAFQRIDGAQAEPGLAAYGLITTLPNGMAYVGSDGRVHALGIGPISTPALEVALQRYSPERMFFYEQRGHGFICIAFVGAPAWCYDVATGEWHERAQDNAAWLARASVKAWGAWYVGTDGGKVALLSDACADFGAPLVRRFISRTMDENERFSVAKIEAFPRPAGDIQGDGDTSVAKLDLRTSRDGGMTWGNPKSRDLGVVGNYQNRVTWRALGQFRRATIELSLSSVTDIPMLAEVDVEIA